MLHLLHFLHVIAFVLCRVTAKDATLFIKIWKYQKLFVHLQSRNEMYITTAVIIDQTKQFHAWILEKLNEKLSTL